MRRAIAIHAIAIAVLCAAPAALAQGGVYYDVTVTNLTRGQVFTPLAFATHRASVQPFVPGQPASVELEILAESGDPVPLAELLLSLPQVEDVQAADGVLPPGHSVTVRVRVKGQANRLSVLGMLVPTNDTFVALNTVPIAPGTQRAMFTALAWDAGTEANDEDCMSIPGPPTVCTGEGYNPDRDDTADFVHVQNGIHGSPDLSAAAYDWRNPVARVVVERVAGHGGDDENSDDEHDDSPDALWSRR